MDIEHGQAGVRAGAEQLVQEVPEPTSLLIDLDAMTEWETRHDLLPLVKQLAGSAAPSGLDPVRIHPRRPRRTALHERRGSTRHPLQARRAVAEAIKEREEGP
ncbi:hypothetical protein [Streptomyces sp. NPDC093225]|uniref:hypothetical protein n=1 Tax=Streptomyces sp. NPDC093225 TaxID=3366034 RepID=UPI0038099195